jgi:hypothetical protein
VQVLIGALIGGVMNTLVTFVMHKIRGQPYSWKEAVGSFVGGAIGGALFTCSFGASALEAGGLKAVGFLSADGALTFSSERATDNALEKKPLTEQLAHDAIEGAIVGPLNYFFVSKPLGKLLTNVVTPQEGQETLNAVRGVARTILRPLGINTGSPAPPAPADGAPPALGEESLPDPPGGDAPARTGMTEKLESIGR